MMRSTRVFVFVGICLGAVFAKGNNEIVDEFEGPGCAKESVECHHWPDGPIRKCCPGLFCEYTGRESYCDKCRKESVACGGETECCSGLNCEMGPGGRQCMNITCVKQGVICYRDKVKCCPGSFCKYYGFVGDICTAYSKVGERCGGEDQCSPGLTCEDVGKPWPHCVKRTYSKESGSVNRTCKPAGSKCWDGDKTPCCDGGECAYNGFFCRACENKSRANE